MSKKCAFPDAWDDDYTATVDSKSGRTTSAAEAPRMSRAARKAQHEKDNKELWDSAENPNTFSFVDVKEDVPLKSEFKPALKVLSRKPKEQPKPSRQAMQGLSLDDEDDSEEEARKAAEKSFRERSEKAVKEREEKQRKYEEVRARLFGTASADASVITSEKPSPTSSRTRGKSRRGNIRPTDSARSSQPISSAEQSPSRSSKQLYDPNAVAPRSSSVYHRRAESGQPKAEQPLRLPKGPDGSGRGGHGFASRGGDHSTTLPS